jgi:anti-sigma B factor antagonist
MEQGGVLRAGQTLLRCWTEAAAGTIVLHAEGEVDIMTAPMLGDAIEASYRVGPRVIVDLGRLRYLDGSGVRVLENAAQAHRTRFVVVGSSREIQRVFEVLGLIAALPVVPSLDAAREYFGSQ